MQQLLFAASGFIQWSCHSCLLSFLQTALLCLLILPRSPSALPPCVWPHFSSSFSSYCTLQAARHAARAMHICPWRPLQTALAARTSVDASLTSAHAAQRLSATFPLSHLCRATQSYQALPTDLPDQAALMDMAAVRVTGAVAQPCVLGAAEDVRIVYRVMY